MPGRLGRLGRGPPRNNVLLFAAFIFFFSWLVDAEKRQTLQHKSPSEQRAADPHISEATNIPPQVETPLTASRRKNTLSVEHQGLNQDESAIALADSVSAVELKPPSRRSSATTAGLASPHLARSLEDWEVEDFVLLATVDGRLWARDRKTGKERWHLEVENAMVETTHFRDNRSAVDEGYDPNSIDDYLWVVEPSRDGALYIYRHTGLHRGLVNTGLTIKNLVEESPFKNADPPVVYTGRKNTSMITVDARTGNVLSWFGSDGGSVAKQENCPIPTGLIDSDSGACSSNATLVLGRTEYVVNIRHNDGRAIAVLKYSEWGPNNYDQDLQRQYHATLDNKYIYTSHDGGVMGFDYDRSSANSLGRLFRHKLPSPVVRVFDVARPWGTEKNDPELVVLPQPTPPGPSDDATSESNRAGQIFLNHTEDGSWFAMSGKSYPMAVQGPRQAPCSQHSWLQQASPTDLQSLCHSEALVGIHSVDTERQPMLTISGPVEDAQNTTSSHELVPELAGDLTIFQRAQQLPKIARDSLISLISNPILILCLVGLLVTNQRQMRAWIGRIGHDNHGGAYSERNISTSDSLNTKEISIIPSERVLGTTKGIKLTESNENAGTTNSTASFVEITGQNASDLVESGPPHTHDVAATTKKKARRGQRGGVKHRKGRNASQDSSDPNVKAVPTVEDAVQNAKKLGEPTKLEPDIRTVPQDPAEVSGPIIRIGALEVNTEQLIGTGSNGTMVFQGRFDGRDVAVKRMLIQFFDIASQETKLLRESDDHPNVIRYFAQQQAAGFLYIALELCPASLAEVIEKPHLHQELAQGGERDLPHVLYQITHGLQHLHNLRIVHRDLKPQNILVSQGKDGKPRMLVSDFGLCKKLEGEQSSFRATTAHAAGTSGWRAPELLLDDDAKEHGESTMIDASTDGGSGSALTSAELMTNRRATRAIDIFSLGLVFFYVLTKGSHPFDCGDRYMREVNIRKGTYNLKLLEVLGDYAYEAKDLVGSMLSPEPKRRPQAHQVMSHPFFWSPKKRLNFLCDVSDHFEKEKREPATDALMELERSALAVTNGDFLRYLGKDFIDSMGKQRKYTGSRLLDLLRALRNKRNHYEDMSEKLKKDVGPLPDGYLNFWTRRFPNLLITCWNVVYEVEWEQTDRFRDYYQPDGI